MIQATQERILGFVNYLRAEGYTLGIQESLDLLKSISACSLPDEKITHHIFRSLACHNHDDWTRFDEDFSGYWYPQDQNLITDEQGFPGSALQQPFRRRALSGLSGTTEIDPEQAKPDDDVLGAGAGEQNSIAKADFRFITNKRAAREAEILAERLARKLRRKLKRKYTLSTRGKNLDIRRTIRKNLKYAGDPFYPLFTVRIKQPPHFVILHDVSHSMTWNNPLLFRFTRGMTRAFPDSKAFAFHTRLFEITHLYKERSLEIMKSKLEQQNHLWMGGTCIADSLLEFTEKYARKFLKPSTQLLIISDGFDTNSPELLGNVLSQLRENTNRTIWLNPMLGRAGFSWDAAVIEHVHPHVDFFQPAHSVASLEDTVNYLARNL